MPAKARGGGPRKSRLCALKDSLGKYLFIKVTKGRYHRSLQ